MRFKIRKIAITLATACILLSVVGGATAQTSTTTKEEVMDIIQQNPNNISDDDIELIYDFYPQKSDELGLTEKESEMVQQWIRWEKIGTEPNYVNNESSPLESTPEITESASKNYPTDSDRNKTVDWDRYNYGLVTKVSETPTSRQDIIRPLSPTVTVVDFEAYDDGYAILTLSSEIKSNLVITDANSIKDTGSGDISFVRVDVPRGVWTLKIPAESIQGGDQTVTLWNGDYAIYVSDSDRRSLGLSDLRGHTWVAALGGGSGVMIVLVSYVWRRKRKLNGRVYNMFEFVHRKL